MGSSLRLGGETSPHPQLYWKCGVLAAGLPGKSKGRHFLSKVSRHKAPTAATSNRRLPRRGLWPDCLISLEGSGQISLYQPCSSCQTFRWHLKDWDPEVMIVFLNGTHFIFCSLLHSSLWISELVIIQQCSFLFDIMLIFTCLLFKTRNSLWRSAFSSFKLSFHITDV